MSRKTDLELTEYQEKIKNSFIHVNLFNGWVMDMDYFIDENFNYISVLESDEQGQIPEKEDVMFRKETIEKEIGKLPDYIIALLNKFIQNIEIDSIKRYYNRVSAPNLIF